MKRAHIYRLLAIALALGVTTACKSDGESPVGANTGPGTLRVVLAAVDNQGAAIQFDINGSGITNVKAAAGLTIYQRTEANTVKVVVLGSLNDGTLVTFDVPDVRANYTVNSIGVAGSSNQLLAKNLYVLSIDS